MLLSYILLSLWVTVVTSSKYLVSLKPSETIESFFKYEVAHSHRKDVKSFVNSMFNIGNFTGFTGEFTSDLLEDFRKCPLIADITPDFVVRAMDIEVQEHAPRHLARLSQRHRLKGDLDYFYHEASGLGVNAYVIDSGIQLNDTEFEGRAEFGRDFTAEGSGDKNGHGTHVAGIIGSRSYGVSKDVDLIEVKALDHSGAGSLSTIIAAIEFAVNHRKESGRPGVANLSLGAARNKVLNQAIDAALSTGLIMVVAAGNSNVNACLTSPASSESAITVGAIDDYFDSLASFSNWGECVDIFASGTAVKSVNAYNPDRPQVLSGTSMSAPVVAGLAANLLSRGTNPEDIKEMIIDMSTKKMISRSSLFLKKKTPNRIAFNGIEDFASDDDD